MAKPTATTEWCSDASYVEPSAGKKLVGFDPGERPPAQYLDWLFFTLELWIAWLDGIVAPSEAGTSEAVSMSQAGNILADGKHGDRKLILHPASFVEVAGGGTVAVTGASITVTAGASPQTVVAPLNLRVGDRIRSALIYVLSENGSAHELSLVRVDRTSGATTEIADNNLLTAGEEVLAAIDHTVLEDFAYYVLLNISDVVTPGEVVMTYAEVTYDRP